MKHLYRKTPFKVHSCHRVTAVSFPTGLDPTGWHSNTNTPMLSMPDHISHVCQVHHCMKNARYARFMCREKKKRKLNEEKKMFSWHRFINVCVLQPCVHSFTFT